DEGGRAEIEHEGTKHPGMARIMVKAPDGWLHLYALEPHTIKALVDLQNPWPSEQPPYVYLLNKSSNVTGTSVKIVTADTEELQVDPKGRGWRTKQDPAHLDTETQFAIGAILGDWAEDPTSAQTMGQIVIGCIPIVGEVAAARDLIAGIHKMIETKGKEGKLETVMSLIGLLPFLHGVLKAVAKKAKGGRVGAKVVNHALEEAAPRIQKELAQTALHDPVKLEKMFPGIHGASGEATGLTAFSDHLARAAKEGGTTAQEFAQIAAKHFEELGKNAGDLVMLTKQRSWFEFMVALKQGGKPGEELMHAMQVWRTEQVTAIEKALADESRRISEALGRDVKAPQFGPTGSKGPLSDIDLSFTGTSASAQASWAERYITNRIGASSFEEARKVLNLGIFTEAKRLHTFTGLGKAGSAIETAMVKEAELNVFAKMLKEGASESELKAFAQNAGIKVPWEKVTVRAEELRKLAADPVLRHQKALELDALARRFEAAGRAEKPAIATEMAYKQALLNAAEKDAYVTPGGALKQVSMREGERVAMSAQARYMDVLDQTQMIGHTLGEIHSLGITPENAKALAKYTDRMVITAGQLKSIDIAAATTKGAKAKQLFEDAEMLLTLARKNPATAAKAAGTLNDAQRLLSELLTDIVKGSKEAELAAAAVDKEAARKAAHAVERQLELLGHAGHIGDAVVHNLGRGAGEVGSKAASE
ncbi:MAG TPA: hypothetical protein VGZ22_20285, partial [Isosphaeraceae bacterium]|nr:hypothetical protein [Isosphaeraceae bacterium]